MSVKQSFKEILTPKEGVTWVHEVPKSVMDDTEIFNCHLEKIYIDSWL